MGYKKFTCLGNSTAASIIRYNFNCFSRKILGLWGVIDQPSSIKNPIQISDQIRVVDLQEEHLTEVIDYDRSVLGFDRSDFMSQWLLPGDEDLSKPVVAFENGKVVGFGTIRNFDNYWSISPIYANSPDTAREMLYNLLQKIKPGTLAFISTLASCREILTFTNDHQWSIADSEIRTYSDRNCMDLIEKTVDWTKVYGMHEYYPV